MPLTIAHSLRSYHLATPHWAHYLANTDTLSPIGDHDMVLTFTLFDGPQHSLAVDASSIESVLETERLRDGVSHPVSVVRTKSGDVHDVCGHVAVSWARSLVCGHVAGQLSMDAEFAKRIRGLFDVSDREAAHAACDRFVVDALRAARMPLTAEAFESGDFWYA